MLVSRNKPWEFHPGTYLHGRKLGQLALHYLLCHKTFGCFAEGLLSLVMGPEEDLGSGR